MKLRTVLTTATTAALLSTAGIAIAGAATSPSPSSSAPAVSASDSNATKPAIAQRRHRRHHRVRVFVRKVVTDTIGIDRATLRGEVRSGKTIAEIATAHNVEPSAVVDALVTAATTKLEAAATAGKITEERAHKIEAKLPDRFTKLVNEWHPRNLRDAAAKARQ